MKTFGQLKPGDTIYYYDHGDIHAQIVHSVDTTPEIHEYTDWEGNKQQYNINRTIIKVESGKIYKLYWESTSSTTIVNYMRRFADLEAAKDWIYKRYMKASNKKNKYIEMLSKENKIIDRYKKLLNFLTPDEEMLS